MRTTRIRRTRRIRSLSKIKRIVGIRDWVAKTRRDAEVRWKTEERLDREFT